MSRQRGKTHMLYTVWDNRTDRLVILDGTASECAEAMGMTYKSFQSAVTFAKNGKVKRWHIEKVDRREEKE